MKLLVLTITLLAGAWAQSLSGEYLPPVEESSSNVVETNFLENEPAHSLAEDGYRYKTVRRFRFRHRRDVNELSNEYLPPAASAPEASFSSFESAPEESYEVEASAPAHELAQDGYRYRTVKRYRLRRNRRRRRDVSELSNEYLPPAASAPGPSYSSYESAPAAEYSAPVAAVESYDVEASAPAHELAQDGYRYKTVKRYRLRRVRRRRRDVSELSNEYLPPAASAPGASYSSYESAPAAEYSAPVAAVESYDVEASAPAHELAQDGYRYKTVKRYRLRRRRRDVNELSNEYLPPAASAPEASFESAPEESYEVEASAPAHELAQDGYRYKTVKRYRLRRVRRRRRDVSELSNEYLPPAASAPGASYSSYESAPAAEYSAPVAAVESYDVEASAPAHELAQDGYRYKTVKRYRLRRRRRDVNELSNEYLPPAASAPEASFAPEESYEVEASAPAHELAQDGYRYRTVKRYRLRRLRRRRRDVSELNTSYLPPAASAPAPSYDSAPAPAYSAPAPSFSAPAPAVESYEVEASVPAPAHTLSDDGYRYKTVKRYRLRRRF